MSGNALKAEKYGLEWVGGGQLFFSEKKFLVSFVCLLILCLLLFFSRFPGNHCSFDMCYICRLTLLYCWRTKLRSLILKLVFCDSCFQNLTNSNKTVHGDKAQLPPIFH